MKETMNRGVGRVGLLGRLGVRQIAPVKVQLSTARQVILTAKLDRRFCARTEHGGAHYKYWYRLTDEIRTTYAYSKGEAYSLLKALAHQYHWGLDWCDNTGGPA